MVSKRVKLEEVINQAKAAMENGSPDSAISLCHYIFKYYPRCLEATRILGEAYTEKRLLDEADALFIFVLAADPQDVLGFVDRGFVGYEHGQVEDAIMYYERALELDPNIEQLRTELLRLYRERFGSSRAKIRITKAGLAHQRLRDGFYNQAIEEYLAILRETPDRLDIQVSLMEAYWRNSDYPRAEGLALDLLEQHSYLIKANLVLWHIYGVRRHQDKSQNYIEKAQALDPLHVVAERLFEDTESAREALHYLNLLGVAYIPEPTPEALEDAAKAAALIPVWVTADPNTDIALGLKGAPIDEPEPQVAAVGAATSDDWLSRLLEDTQQVTDDNAHLAEEAREKEQGLAQLEAFRKSDDDDFALFEQLPETTLVEFDTNQPKAVTFQADEDELGAFDLNFLGESKSDFAPERFDLAAVATEPAPAPIERKGANPLQLDDFGSLDLEGMGDFEPELGAFETNFAVKDKINLGEKKSAMAAFDPTTLDEKSDFGGAGFEFDSFDLNSLDEKVEPARFDPSKFSEELFEPDFALKDAGDSTQSRFDFAAFDPAALDDKLDFGEAKFELDSFDPVSSKPNAQDEDNFDLEITAFEPDAAADDSIQSVTEHGLDRDFEPNFDFKDSGDGYNEPKFDFAAFAPQSEDKADFDFEVASFAPDTADDEEEVTTERGLDGDFEPNFAEAKGNWGSSNELNFDFSPQPSYQTSKPAASLAMPEEDEQFVNSLLEADDDIYDAGQNLSKDDLELEPALPVISTTKVTAPLLPDHAFHLRDERGTIPDYVLGVAPLDAMPEAVSGNQEVDVALAVEEGSSKESDDMPIKRGTPDEDKDLFDWEREELPDYLRAFAMDTDEVAKQDLAAPNAPIADVATNPARIRPRKPDAGAPNDLPDWLNPAGVAPRGDQMDLGGSRQPTPNQPKDLPGWLDANDAPAAFNPADLGGDMLPFNIEGGDAFGGPSLQPPPQMRNPTPPAPPKNEGFQRGLDMGGDPTLPDDMDLQPFSFGDDFGAPPTPPPARQSPPPSRQAPPPANNFGGIPGMDDIAPFDGGNFGNVPTPPSRQPAAPPPLPKNTGYGLDMGGDPTLPDDMDLQPFSFGDDFGTPSPPSRQSPPPPSRQNPPPARQAPPPANNFGGIPGMDDIAPFDGGNFGAPPTPPPSRQAPPPSRQAPPPPKNEGFQRGLDMGGDPTLPDDMDLQPFSFGDDFGAPPTPPPARQSPPPSRQAPPPANNFGGIPGMDDIAPFDGGNFGAPPTPPSSRQAPPPANNFRGIPGMDDIAPFDPLGGGGTFGNPQMPGGGQPDLGAFPFDPTTGPDGFTEFKGSLKDLAGAPPPTSRPPTQPPNRGGGRAPATPFGFPGGQGLDLPDNIDDFDLQAFDTNTLDIPGINNGASPFRVDPDSYPSQPYFPTTGRSRLPAEPEIEAEPGQEKPLRGFGWLKGRKREAQSNRPEDNDGKSIKDKMREKRQQFEDIRVQSGTNPLTPEPFLPEDVAFEAFEAIPSFEEVERLADSHIAQPFNPLDELTAPPASHFSPMTDAEETTMRSFSFEDEPALPEPFSIDFGEPVASKPTEIAPVDHPRFEEKPLTTTFALPDFQEPQPFALENEGKTASAKLEPEFQDFTFDVKEEKPLFDPSAMSFDLGEMSKSNEPDLPAFSFDEPKLDVPAAFSLDALSEDAPPSFSFIEPEAATFSFDEPKSEAKPELPAFSLFDEPEADVPAAFSLDALTEDAPPSFSFTEPEAATFSFDEPKAEAQADSFTFFDPEPATAEGNEPAGFTFFDPEPASQFTKEPALPDFDLFSKEEPDIALPAFEPLVPPKTSSTPSLMSLDEAMKQFNFSLEPEAATAPIEALNPLVPETKLPEGLDFFSEPKTEEVLPDFAFSAPPEVVKPALPDFTFAQPAFTEPLKVELPETPLVVPVASTPASTAPVTPTSNVSNLNGEDKVGHYLKLVREKPRDLVANLGLGNAYFEQKQYNQAVECFAKIIKQADRPSVDDIVKKLQGIPTNEQATPRFHRVLGDAYMKQGYHHWALSEYSKALSAGRK